MNQNREILGDVVWAARKSRHLFQEALAERIGVCKRTIQAQIADRARSFCIKLMAYPLLISLPDTISAREPFVFVFQNLKKAGLMLNCSMQSVQEDPQKYLMMLKHG